MPRPRKVSEETILQTARDIFISRGPSASTHLIAEALGLSTAALFNHFPTKKDLLIAALAPPKRIPWITQLKDGPNSDDLEVQLLRIAHSIQSFFIEMGPRLLVLHASEIKRSELFAYYDIPPPLMAIQGLQEWLEQAKLKGLIREIDARNTAQSFLGALHFDVFLMHISNKTEQHPSLDIHILASIFAIGLRP